MTDSLIADRLASVKTLPGWLRRGGKTWGIPIIKTARFLGRGDDLFLGDRITFGDGLQSQRTLLLGVVFKMRQMLVAHHRPDAPLSRRGTVSYELFAQVACPDCGHSVVHPVTAADIGRYQAGGSWWTFTRTCRECEHMWMQDGRWPIHRRR